MPDPPTLKETPRKTTEKNRARWVESGCARCGCLVRKGVNSHDELLATQKRVADELASSQGDGGLGVSHLDDQSISLSMMRDRCRNEDVLSVSRWSWEFFDGGLARLQPISNLLELVGCARVGRENSEAFRPVHWRGLSERKALMPNVWLAHATTASHSSSATHLFPFQPHRSELLPPTRGPPLHQYTLEQFVNALQQMAIRFPIRTRASAKWATTCLVCHACALDAAD